MAQLDGTNRPLTVASAAEPVAASGVALSCAANATDYTATLVAGGLYRVASHNGRLYLGLADTTQAANRLLTVPAGGGELWLMPAGVTELHYCTDSGAGVAGTMAALKTDQS